MSCFEYVELVEQNKISQSNKLKAENKNDKALRNLLLYNQRKIT